VHCLSKAVNSKCWLRQLNSLLISFGRRLVLSPELSARHVLLLPSQVLLRTSFLPKL